MGLFQKWKLKQLKSIYFWNVQAERNNLIYHSCKSDVVEIWPHLTFGWPFVNISLTMHPTHSKLYIFVILMTSRVIWYTWKLIWSILKFWPPLDLCVTPTGKGPNRSKNLSKYFLTYNDFRTINDSFSSKWHLSTSSTTSSIAIE